MAGLPAGKRRARRTEGAELASPVQEPLEQETAEPEPLEPDPLGPESPPEPPPPEPPPGRPPAAVPPPPDKGAGGVWGPSRLLTTYC